MNNTRARMLRQRVRSGLKNGLIELKDFKRYYRRFKKLWLTNEIFRDLVTGKRLVAYDHA